jgi:O-antigen/teichoic acid export membrane protein
MKQPEIEWLKRLIKEDVGLVYTTLGGLCSSLLSAFFWFILASILEVKNYGLVNYYIALASIFAALGTMGLNTTVTTYLAKQEGDLLYEANSLTLLSGVVLAFILSAFQWSSGLLSATMIFFGMTLAEMLGRKKYREYAFMSIGQRLAQISLSILLYFQLGILGIILGYFLGFLVFSYRYLKSIRKFTLKISNLKERRNFALHSYGFNLIGSLSTYLDKVIIGAVFGYYTLGLYQLGFQFLMLLSIIPGSFYQYLLPEESSGKDKQEVKLIGLILSAAASLAAFAISPYLIKSLFPTFIDAIQIVKVMSLAVIPSTIVAMLTASLLGKERSKIVLTAGLAYLASLITGLIIMGKTMGVIGLALTPIIAQTIQATYLSINASRK